MTVELSVLDKLFNA